jgi:hypothetical protein
VRRLTIVVGGDVEAGRDLAQEAYARAYRAWDRFDGTDVRAWLHTRVVCMEGNEPAMSEHEPTVPEGAGPVDVTGPGTATGRGGPPTVPLIGLGVIAAIAAILLVVFLLRPGSDPVGEVSPAPSAPPTSPEPTEGATPSASFQGTPAATSSAPATIPETWTDAAVFAEPGKRYVLGDLVAWSDGLVAVGTVYEEEGRSVFGPPPPRAGRVWRSTDGTDWTDVTPTDTFADVELVHLFEAADGALVVIGHSYPDVATVSAAWETSDGETWTRVELAGIPEEAFMLQVASGAQGHVAAVSVGTPNAAMYSSDGRTWEPTLDEAAVNTLAAGDEGFVASLLRPGSEEAPAQVMASADGLEWFDATEPDDGSFLAAPRGGDWLASTTTVDFDDPSIAVVTWGSPNGLDWSRLGDMALGTDDPFGSDCSETPATLHGLPTMTVAATLWTFGCGEGAVINAGASYASVDGAAWMRLPFGDQAYAAGAAMIGDRVVIATDARTGNGPVIGVTFWIGEP